MDFVSITRVIHEILVTNKLLIVSGVVIAIYLELTYIGLCLLHKAKLVCLRATIVCIIDWAFIDSIQVLSHSYLGRCRHIRVQSNCMLTWILCCVSISRTCTLTKNCLGHWTMLLVYLIICHSPRNCIYCWLLVLTTQYKTWSAVAVFTHASEFDCVGRIIYWTNWRQVLLHSLVCPRHERTMSTTWLMLKVLCEIRLWRKYVSIVWILAVHWSLMLKMSNCTWSRILRFKTSCTFWSGSHQLLVCIDIS